MYSISLTCGGIVRVVVDVGTCACMYRPSMGYASRCTAVYMHWHEISLIPVMYGSSVISVNVLLYSAIIFPRRCGGTAVLYM